MTITEILTDKKIDFNKYKPLTPQQIIYLIAEPTHNYWFKKIGQELSTALNNLANDNGFNIKKVDTYEPVNEYRHQSRSNPLPIKKKKDGVIITFIRKDAE